jgi:hypothetical protein
MKYFSLKAVPTFRILDYEKAISFYMDWMEFHLDWEHRLSPEDPVYMQISLNGLCLHLSENPRFKTGNIVFVETHHIENLHARLADSSTHFSAPEISKTPWGTLQMEIEDPFGNLLRFNETL